MKTSVKSVLFLCALLVGLAGCAPQEIVLPNGDLKYANGVVEYKGKPYSGKVIITQADKDNGFDGYVNLKDGHLDGMMEMKSPDGEKLKANTVNGQFDGDYISEYPNLGQAHLVFKAGKVKSVKLDFNVQGGIKQDLTIADDRKINGTMTTASETITFKNGEAQTNGVTIKLYMNEEEKTVKEIYSDGKLVQKDVAKAASTPEFYEKLAFPAIFNGEKMDMSLVR